MIELHDVKVSFFGSIESCIYFEQVADGLTAKHFCALFYRLGNIDFSKMRALNAVAGRASHWRL